MTDFQLKLVGASLYLGEGTKLRKTNKGYIYAIEITNTDSRIIVMFLKFLRRIIKPVEEKVKAQLFIYDINNESYLVQYWSNVTNIPVDRFQKTIILTPRSKRFKPSKFGIMKIRYNHKEHFLKLQGIIDNVFGGVG